MITYTPKGMYTPLQGWKRLFNGRDLPSTLERWLLPSETPRPWNRRCQQSKYQIVHRLPKRCHVLNVDPPISVPARTRADNTKEQRGCNRAFTHIVQLLNRSVGPACLNQPAVLSVIDSRMAAAISARTQFQLDGRPGVSRPIDRGFAVPV